MITTAQMGRLEDLSERFGVSKLMLMERAGRSVADYILRKFDPSRHHVLVFCGSGNNGGDGFVAARHLAGRIAVFVLFFGDEERLSPEAAANLARIQGDHRVEILRPDDVSPEAFKLLVSRLDGKRLILVDAILGTGVKGKVRTPLDEAIRMFNRCPGHRICVDVPSGIDADTGKPAGLMAVPNVIITFHDRKPGLAAFKNVIVADIGIPDEAIAAGAIKVARKRGLRPCDVP